MSGVTQVLLWALIFWHLTACTHRVLLNSEPAGANVYVVDETGKRGSLVAKTPTKLVIPSNKSYVSYEIQKLGYQSSTLVIPNLSGASMTIGVKLTEVNESYIKERFQKLHSKVHSDQFLEILKLQNAIIEQQVDEVERLAQKMKPEFELISVWHSMLGHHYLFRNDRKRAAAYYRQALKLDAENLEAASGLRHLGLLDGE